MAEAHMRVRPRLPILAALILLAPARAPAGEAPLLPSPARALGARIGDAWSDPSNPIVRIFEGKRLDLWSFRKPVAPELPAVEDAAWPRTPIDRFILAGLERAGLRPSLEADRRTLIRRLSFGITGLPPSPAEVDAFLADGLPGAYERLVERLLASPRHGEHWARHWLDVVRYADTNGHERDEFRRDMYRYRDYIIRAFNEDRPYDELIREQLAGDEMLDGKPATRRDADRLIATGFLRLGLHDSTASIFQEEAKARNELMADLVNTTGAAFLGLTLACSNCHDHKYDPISQADHFRFRAFFASVEPRDDVPVDVASEQARIEAHNAEVEAAALQLDAQAAAILEPSRRAMEAERRGKLPTDIQALLEIDAKDRGEEARKKLEPHLESLKVSDEDALKAIDELSRKLHGELVARAAAIRARKLPFAFAPILMDSSGEPPATRIFHQGDFTEPRDEVPPGFLSALDPNPAEIRRPAARASTGRRSALADWIASPANPFTARVMVNRIWQQHFGRPLVGTPNDFGHSGERPANQELLDWLAVDFMEHGWSLKHVQRTILLSAAYRQASIDDPARREKDPDNRLLWRQDIRRLSAEAMRDAMLHVTGRLREHGGGRPLWPPVAEEILDAQPAILETHSDQGARDRLQGYYADPLEETYVRTVFLVQKRCVPLPFLQVFDLPEMSSSCGRRDVTTVAPQALNLLNSEFTLAMARSLAERVAAEAGGHPALCVERAFRLALQREPTPAEKEVALRLLSEGGDGGAAPPGGLLELSRALLNVNEFVYVD